MITPDETAAATLLSLPSARPARLRAILDHCGGAIAAVDAIADGTLAASLATSAESQVSPALLATWRNRLEAIQIAVIALLERRGTRVLSREDPDWPLQSADSTMPVFLFAEGSGFEALRRPRVAIVGTRRPTPHGAADAREIAERLTHAGVVVVSGLAYGIDGAAHEATIAAGGLTVGITATGLDVVYPARHHRLFGDVRDHGVVLSEQPFGTPPRREYFPIRNRIIVGTVDAVVIVEAAVRGGAMRTAQIAADLGVSLFAIPGSRRNPMAEGCNRLIADGATPIVDPLDVVALVSGMNPPGAPGKPRPLQGLSAAARAAYRALGGEPATLDQVVSRSGLEVATAAGACRELERGGRVRRSGGRIWPM